MTDPLTKINLLETPQSQSASPDQVLNSAGGYTFKLDDIARLRRFLIIGVDGGTYYVSEQKLTADNAALVIDLAKNRTAELISATVEVSLSGAAPRQNPTLFALAAAASFGDLENRQAALQFLPVVARTGTHLFMFIQYVKQFRGWGRSLRRAVASWYLTRSVDDTAYQVLKYRQRFNWTHRDALRLSHPVTDEVERKALFSWICGHWSQNLPTMVSGFEKAQTADVADIPELVTGYKLSWEMLPDAALLHPPVWEALLSNHLPQTALLRQLPRLTRLGILTQMSPWTDLVSKQLTDPALIRKARIHPLSILIALRTYVSGQGRRDTSWTPVPKIIDALDSAFYSAFDVVEPTNKRIMLALDVSGSMTSPLGNLPITCREATAALAMVTAAVEPKHLILGFSDQPTANSNKWGGRGWNSGGILTPLPISPRQRLDDVCSYMDKLPFSGTDCALPMLYAIKNNLEIDTFVVITDNETYAGNIQPHQALVKYRKWSGIDARCIVVGMTATSFTVADSADAGMLDVVGFDTGVPQLISEFSRGF